MKRKFKIAPFATVVLLLLIVYTLILIVPLVWGVNISFKTQLDALQNPFKLPKPFSPANYVTVFNEFKVEIEGANFVKTTYYMENMIWFTFVYAVGCSFVNIAVVCLVAYITARYDFKICRIVDAIVIVTMILPIVGSMPSELRIMKALGLYDSLWGMMLMKANFLGGTTFLIFNVNFRSLPKDFAEAASLDGASNLAIMTKVMLPLAKTIFLTLWLLSFIQFWNDYQTPLLYFPSRPTLSYGLFLFTQATGQKVKALPVKLAACYMLMIPILVVFVVFQKKLIGNVSMGGLKE